MTEEGHLVKTAGLVWE